MLQILKLGFYLKKNFWAKIEVQTMNYWPSCLKDPQAAAQRAGSILKHASMFNHTLRKKKPFFNFVEKYLFL